MKEQSIEEKARRYDEALTKARNIVNSINVGLIGKDSFGAVFPELAESEDDKIKKDIIQCVKYSGDNFIPFYKSTVGDMISYLEKQGEQKPAWGEEDEKKRKRIMHRLSLDGTINNKDLSDINDWLKSIKDRYTWKPSDEQMKALEYYLRNVIDREGVFGRKMVELYEDLWNLREE